MLFPVFLSKKEICKKIRNSKSNKTILHYSYGKHIRINTKLSDLNNVSYFINFH